jgi:hypothetical protein
VPLSKVLFSFYRQYGAMRTRSLFVALLAWPLAAGQFAPAGAAPLVAMPMPRMTMPASGASCRPAITAAEQAAAIPPLLMVAIGKVESGRRDPATGLVVPWPWTINAEGQGSYYDSKAQAIAAVRALQARGVQSIDVGCMQINLLHHPNAFASLDQAFDPSANAAYAAHFLNDLHAQSNDWLHAAGQYHSSTPELGAAYQTQVAAGWTEERHLADAMPLLTAAAPAAMSPIANVGFHGLVPTMQHGTRPVGRDLAGYRAMPVQFAARAPPMVRRD